MSRMARVALGMVVFFSVAVGAVATWAGRPIHDVGLLTLAFLGLCPVVLAVEIIPGWIESFQNLKKAADRAAEERPLVPAGEAEG